jgi:hypothetical protein
MSKGMVICKNIQRWDQINPTILIRRHNTSLLDVFPRRSTRQRNVSGAVCDDPRVAVGAGRVDGVEARAEA